AVEHGEIDLIVVDPLSSYLAGEVNSWKDQSVRLALAPLHTLAEETNTAVLLIAHLNKGQSEHPLQRLGGSIGIAAAARSVLLLGRDPDDPEAERDVCVCWPRPRATSANSHPASGSRSLPPESATSKQRGSKKGEHR